MCGRYSFFTDNENQEILKIVRAIDTRYPGNQMKTGEIYPTNIAPILKMEQNNIVPDLYMWGFPRFQSKKGVIINARSETAEDRPMFRKSLYNRRCVIPSTGFYEWSQDRKKIKYRFRLPGKNMLYMAGLYNEFNSDKRFVILTTEANLSMADIHNRMPLLLTEDKIEDWIMNEQFSIPYTHAVMPALEREVSTKQSG